MYIYIYMCVCVYVWLNKLARLIKLINVESHLKIGSYEER